MIRRRRSLSSQRSSKEVAPVSRARQAKPSSRRVREAPKEVQEPLSFSGELSVEEMKQEFIWAHAAARKEQGVKPHARFWIISIIIVVAFVTIAGWWLTFSKTVQDAYHSPDGLLQEVKDRSQGLTQDISSPSQQALQQLERLRAQQAAALPSGVSTSTHGQTTSAAMGVTTTTRK